MLKRPTCVTAIIVALFQVVANGVHPSPRQCWITMLASSPPAKAASASLTCTMMVVGVSSGESAVRSKAFPVARNNAGKTGTSGGESERTSMRVGAATVPAATSMTKSPLADFTRAGDPGKIVITFWLNWGFSVGNGMLAGSGAGVGVASGVSVGTGVSVGATATEGISVGAGIVVAVGGGTTTRACSPPPLNPLPVNAPATMNKVAAANRTPRIMTGIGTRRLRGRASIWRWATPPSFSTKNCSRPGTPPKSP